MKLNLKTCLIGLNSAALCLMLILAFTPGKKEQVAYVLNEKVFEDYLGTKHYQKELVNYRDSYQYILDSIAKKTDENDLQALLEIKQQYQLEEEALRQQHTARIWGQINQYVTEYGEKHQYDFIYGASGNGSLMYANESKNITKVVLQYINSRYEGEL